MVWHKLTYHPLDGPLDPDEMAGGYDDAECFHEDVTEVDGDLICDDCGERIT